MDGFTLTDTSKGPFTLSVNVYICIFENNRSNGNKTQMQIMGSIPILCVNINITIDTMLKFDANAGTDVNIDAQCEQTLSIVMIIAKGGRVRGTWSVSLCFCRFAPVQL